jgi:hypothetical protein
VRWLSLLLLVACSPQISVGSDNRAFGETTVCDEVVTSAVSCPGGDWGARATFSSTAALEQRLLGRWAFCGGARRYTGRGELIGFPHGAGIELWREDGELRFAYLRGTVPQVTRSQTGSGTGTVQLELEGGRGRAVLRASDGEEVVWGADLFDGAAVLQNAAYDVWNFVPVTPL